MRYKRKPVVRDTVDAIKSGDMYFVEKVPGIVSQVPVEEFERDYEPAKRDYVRKARTKRTKKGGESA